MLQNKVTEVLLGDEKLFAVDNGKRIRKKDIDQAKGNIPVYSSSKFKDETLGFVSDSIKKIVPKAKKFEGECITVNADATDYDAFVRNESFYANDVLNVIKVLDKRLNIDFVAYQIKEKLKKSELDWSSKMYKGKLKKLSISIPLDAKGNFDLKKQQEIANKFNKIESVKEQLSQDYELITNNKISLVYDYPFKLCNFFEIFELKKGTSKYTRKYINNNKGEFPVYSSNTKNNGLLGKINTFDYNIECIQITTNGVNAGTAFYRKKHEFSINSDAMLLIKKSNKFDYDYLLFEIQQAFSDFGFNWENKVSETRLNNVFLHIPIDENGNFDLKKQQEIANKFNKIESVKEQLSQDYDNIMSTIVEIN